MGRSPSQKTAEAADCALCARAPSVGVVAAARCPRRRRAPSWSERSVDGRLRRCASLLPPGPLPPRVEGAVRDVVPAPDLSGVEGGREGGMGLGGGSTFLCQGPSLPPALLPPSSLPWRPPSTPSAWSCTARWPGTSNVPDCTAEAADRRGRPTMTTTMGHWHAIIPQVVVLCGPRLCVRPSGLVVAVPPPPVPSPGPRVSLGGRGALPPSFPLTTLPLPPSLAPSLPLPPPPPGHRTLKASIHSWS